MTGSEKRARGYTWPPFEAGNDAAVTHGAYSGRRVDPLADEFVVELLADPGVPDHLRRPEFAAALAAWGRAEARCHLLAAWLDGLDAAEPSAEAYVALAAAHRAEATAARLRDALGLTPGAAARLNRDLSASRYMAMSALASVDRLTAAGAEVAARDIAALSGATQPAVRAVERSEAGCDAEPA
jgi:hypothetical protein